MAKRSRIQIAELERALLQLDDALRKFGGQSLPLLTPTNLISAEGNLDQSHISISSAGKIIRAKLPKLRNTSESRRAIIIGKDKEVRGGKVRVAGKGRLVQFIFLF